VFVSANKHWGMKQLLEKFSNMLIDEKVDREQQLRRPDAL
jgi:hypothetical protein